MKRRDLMGIFGCIALVFFSAGALAAPVPETGQTKCYDNNGDVIDPCPLPWEQFYGQDANFSSNPMSYTRLDDNGDAPPKDSAISGGMVRDNVTGLIWEVKTRMDGSPDYSNPHDADNLYTWYSSSGSNDGGYAGTQGNGTTTFDTEEFIKALNDTKFGGYNDWRLPTIKELDSIVNYDIAYPGPTINTAFFQSTKPYDYWTSSYCAGADNVSSAWTVSFDYGYNDRVPKSEKIYVRAVRGEMSQPAYVDNGYTVSDTSSGLMWQKETPDDALTWDQALSYCKDMTLAGYTDWRLPTKKELRSLLDYSRKNLAIDTNFFSDSRSSFYWSSTTSAYAAYAAWGEHLYDGYDFSSYKTNKNYFRAVRGGQSGPKAICHDVIVPAGPNCSASASIDNGSDPYGGESALSLSPPGPYPLGSTLVNLTVTDGNGASSQCTGTVTVVDATSPNIGKISAAPFQLWPPNKKMADVTLNYSVADNCRLPDCRISSITSNEPIGSSDYAIVDARHVKLRADRSGKGNGRIYTITITCSDASGNASNQAVKVPVPSDQRGNLHRH